MTNERCRFAGIRRWGERRWMARVGATLQPWRGRLHGLAALAGVMTARPSPEWLPVELTLVGVGLLLRSWALGHLHKNEELCTSGPYAFTRNPLYLGNGLILCGCCLAAGSVWLALAAWVGAVMVCRAVVQHEEEQLLRTFGASYAAYRRSVPAMIPRIRPYLGSAGTRFSWRQASRNRVAAGWIAVGAVLVAMHAAGAVASAWHSSTGLLAWLP